MFCVKQKCNYYFESDGIVEYCNLADQPIFTPCECVGLKYLSQRKEKIICNIGNLQKELIDLEKIPEIIEKNQGVS